MPRGWEVLNSSFQISRLWCKWSTELRLKTVGSNLDLISVIKICGPCVRYECMSWTDVLNLLIYRKQTNFLRYTIFGNKISLMMSLAMAKDRWNWLRPSSLPWSWSYLLPLCRHFSIEFHRLATRAFLINSRESFITFSACCSETYSPSIENACCPIFWIVGMSVAEGDNLLYSGMHLYFSELCGSFEMINSFNFYFRLLV